MIRAGLAALLISVVAMAAPSMPDERLRDLRFPLLLAWNRPSESEHETYARALAARDAGDYDQAIDEFRRVAEDGGKLATISELRLAETLAEAGRLPDATRVFEAALRDDALPEPLRSTALLESAEALLEVGREEDALRQLDTVAAGGAAPNVRAEAAARAAKLRRELADPAWARDATLVLETSPSQAVASELLDLLEADGIPVDVATAAAVRYRNFENDAAFTLYASLADGSDTPEERAEAWFYLGALHERFGQLDSALEAYEQSIELAPAGPLGDDARWWRARILEASGGSADAISEYDRLVAEYPRSEFAAEAALRAALASLKEGDDGEAAERLRDLARARGSEEAAMAARWLRVLGEAERDDPAPADIDPGSLGAILDDAGDEADDPLPPEALDEAPAGDADWGEVDGWMETRFGKRATTKGRENVIETEATRLAVALHDLEDTTSARLLLAQLPGLRDEPYELLDLARLGQALSLPNVSLAAAGALLRDVPATERLQTPRTVERLAYPAGFAEEVEAAAHAEDIPPLLLLALVRQESAFDRTAGSIAGAQGLTQVVPSTGEEIAESLDVPWDEASLHEPGLSLRFGARYLAAQLEQFDGNVFLALAAYNAGASNATRWDAERELPGIEGLLYAVDFEETARYLEYVIENYAWYRYVYGYADRPEMR